MNGKSNHKLKSMLATIDTMFVNKKIIRIYLFCPFSPRNTRQMYFKRSIVTKTSHPPDRPKKSHRAPPQILEELRGHKDVPVILHKIDLLLLSRLVCNPE